MRERFLPLICTALVGLGCGSSNRTDDVDPTGHGVDEGTTDGGDEGSEPGETGDDGSGNDGDVEPKFDVGSGDTDTAGDGGGPDSPCIAAENTQSNQGCEFWAVDLPNTNVGQAGVPAPSDQQFAIVVANASSEHEAQVGVYVGSDPSPADMVTVEPNATRQIALAQQSIDPTVSTSDGVAYRIESDVPITAYQFNPLDNAIKVYSNDATILFPTHALGTEYTAITEDATSKGATYISVVALEDGTTIDVFPTTDLEIGGAPAATIDRGQVFTVVSQLDDGLLMNGGNLSGSRVSASAPVAVFSGNVSAPITMPDRICCADHMEHQMMPLATWGSAYLVAAPPAGVGYGSDPARYRITGAYDATELIYDPAPPPGAPTTIDQYQTATFTTDAPFTIRSTDPGKPFAVTQFLVSGFLTTLPDLNLRVGDPSMIVLPAVPQLRDRYVFVVPMAYAKNFVTIVSPDGAAVELDGAAVPSSSFSPLGDHDGQPWSYAHVELVAGEHVIHADTAVQVTSVGYDTDVSYGFVAGSGLDIISEPPPPPEG